MDTVAAVAEGYRYRTVACFATSLSPVPLKTRHVGQRCTLNLSRAETSSRWCGVVVRRGGCQLSFSLGPDDDWIQVAVHYYVFCLSSVSRLRPTTIHRYFSFSRTAAVSLCLGDQGYTPKIIEGILTTARYLELEVNEDDIEELIMGHENELTTELQEILNEKPQETQQNVSPSEQEED
ncbi:uncharacterized protein TNCV_2748901 [Trichonephila clavipes]|nr:uncharacterized protein TNCV_2748901 [Trichonephila clavipes]